MRFSILEIVRETSALTFRHILRSFAIGLMPIGLLLSVVVISGYLPTVADDEDMVLSLAAAMLGAFVLSWGLGTVAFNYWVRFGALGPQNAWYGSIGAFLKATLINGIKFFFILLVIALAIVILYAGLALFGIDAMAENPVDVAEGAGVLATVLATLEANSGMANGTEIAVQLMATAVVCGIYSFFSANLTGTAIGDDGEGFEHPHTLEFAVALFIVELVWLVPTFLVALAGQLLVASIMQFVLICPLLAAISIAHGIRYRMCLADRDGADGVAEGV